MELVVVPQVQLWVGWEVAGALVDRVSPKHLNATSPPPTVPQPTPLEGRVGETRCNTASRDSKQERRALDTSRLPLPSSLNTDSLPRLPCHSAEVLAWVSSLALPEVQDRAVQDQRSSTSSDRPSLDLRLPQIHSGRAPQRVQPPLSPILRTRSPSLPLHSTLRPTSPILPSLPQSSARLPLYLVPQDTSKIILLNLSAALRTLHLERPSTTILASVLHPRLLPSLEPTLTRSTVDLGSSGHSRV